MTIHVPLLSVPIDGSVKHLPYADRAEDLIDTANEAVEAFMLADLDVIENFVTCDFHLLDQTLSWIHSNHLLTGNRFCEWGAGFGVATMLAALRGMQAVGIEIESRLVHQAEQVAATIGSSAQFYHGSFVPRGVSGLAEISGEFKNVDTEEGDVYAEIGLELDDFDLIFVFPWPGEEEFFEHIFAACAADGALLLSYHGREGMRLLRQSL
ncbi:hypothetical protein [Allorhodopirellula heiligendammensis]|uniref:Mg-protoporphyrin IX methyl transferase n=1 Tax=Allorhodopirellula heiligendammensis TaxID=2714739 RepID=A0A5C6BW40_9BACT|nr:hypothetical protein [Allorhodopirellula heiligendammensis]TWU16198.1 Mg-protoporphyrin IX methyl transferase [Allorhodopirellula heiligendammensis]